MNQTFYDRTLSTMKIITRVVTVTVVPGVVVVVVVLERPGSQMLNRQKVGSVRGSDSAPSMFNNHSSRTIKTVYMNTENLRQKSVPLDAPIKTKDRSLSSYHRTHARPLTAVECDIVEMTIGPHKRCCADDDGRARIDHLRRVTTIESEHCCSVECFIVKANVGSVSTWSIHTDTIRTLQIKERSCVSDLLCVCEGY